MGVSTVASRPRRAAEAVVATVLIVDDDPLIGLDLSEIVVDATGAEVLVATTFAAAEQHLAVRVDFVLLDVNLHGDTTFALARRLLEERIPFAFASGASRAIIPDDLKAFPFLAKPCRTPLLINAVRAALPPSQMVQKS